MQSTECRLGLGLGLVRVRITVRISDPRWIASSVHRCINPGINRGQWSLP